MSLAIQKADFFEQNLRSDSLGKLTKQGRMWRRFFRQRSINH